MKITKGYLTLISIVTLSLIANSTSAQKTHVVNNKIIIEDRFIEYVADEIDIAISLPQIPITDNNNETSLKLTQKFNTEACRSIASSLLDDDQTIEMLDAYPIPMSPEKLEILALQKAKEISLLGEESDTPAIFNLYSEWSIYSNTQIISLIQKNYTFTGGAHGNTLINISNYVISTGEKLNIDKAIVDTTYFMDKVVKYMCREYGWSKNALKEETGLFVELANLPLPQEIGLTAKGVLVVYQTYDIAPYYYGPMMITIPYKELRDITDGLTKTGK